MEDQLMQQYNCRDLGGLSLGDALRLRQCQIVRGQAPSQFGAEAAAALRAQGFGLVLDLRSAAECAAAAFDWGVETQRLALDIPNDFAGATSLGQQYLQRGYSVENARGAMCASYAQMPAHLHPHLLNIVETIIALDGAPVFIHCTAGKDRTGVFVTLLLLFLGAPMELVVSDYLRSIVYAEQMRQRLVIEPGGHFGDLLKHQEVFDVLIGVDRGFLESATESIVQRWGSIDQYFVDAGLTQSHRRLLLRQMAESIYPKHR